MTFFKCKQNQKDLGPFNLDYKPVDCFHGGGLSANHSKPQFLQMENRNNDRYLVVSLSSERGDANTNPVDALCARHCSNSFAEMNLSYEMVLNPAQQDTHVSYV